MADPTARELAALEVVDDGRPVILRRCEAQSCSIPPSAVYQLPRTDWGGRDHGGVDWQPPPDLSAVKPFHTFPVRQAEGKTIRTKLPVAS